MTAENYFSGCPFCDDDDGYVNIGRNHYFLCKAHGTAWCVGCNLFSGWRDETEEDQRRSRELLQELTIVEPRTGPIVKAPTIQDVGNLLSRLRGAV